jgi:hypothetical protein
VEPIRGVEHIRDSVDRKASEGQSGAFDPAVTEAEEQGIPEAYRGLNQSIPVTLEGVRYFSSKEIHDDR